jgi:hypothetical protein
VPATAATVGGNTGTWYSLRNSSIVLSQWASFSQPAFRNCQLTQRRMAASSGDRS